MDFLQSILENYNTPILSAFVLGLMTAISPCPLATNITAVAYISKNITDKRKVFLNGIFYSLGRAFSYTTIGIILYFGVNKFHVAKLFQQNGEKYLGPVLIIIGLVLLGVLNLNFFKKSNFQEKYAQRFREKGVFGSFLIGIIFALAFCPYSGVLYFGILIPMTITSAGGLYLPFIFAIATGLPVIIFTYLLAYSINKVSAFHKSITNVEKVMRILAGIVFIITGLYYISIFFI